MTPRHRLRDMLRQLWRMVILLPPAGASLPTEGEPASGTAPEDPGAVLSRQARTERIDLTDGWTLHVGGHVLCLRGPGELTIDLYDFTPEKLTYTENPRGGVRGLSFDHRWSYPVWRPTPDEPSHLDLELWISGLSITANFEGKVEPWYYLLFVGPAMWSLSASTGARLEGWFELIHEQSKAHAQKDGPQPGEVSETPV